MLTLQEFIEEKILVDLIKSSLPKPILHWLKHKLHHKQYMNALETYKEIVNDKNRNVSPQVALATAAKTVGISARELQKVWDNINTA